MPGSALQDRRRRLLVALVAIAAVALALRLVTLGERVAHWDEARVAYWTLWYHDHGVWEYYPVVHGPFLFHVNETVFGLVGPTDLAMRVPVALITGASPLAAWLYRDHLDDVETVVLGAVLAINPVLLYYGRFSRNDAILATMMLVAFGFVLRAMATRRVWYLYPIAASLAFGFTMKENALLYLLCWAGAGTVVLAHGLVYDRLTRGPPPGGYRAAGRSTVGSLRPTRAWVTHGVGATAIGVAILAAFFAPRGTADPGLGDVVTAPWRLPAALEAALVVPAERLFEHWIVSHDRIAYLEALWFYLEVLAAGAVVVCLFAVAGLVLEHVTDGRPRWVVPFAFVWGLLSVGGYAFAAGTPWDSAWIAVHMVAPLAIPAAVGIGFVVDEFLAGIDARDAAVVAGSGLILLAVVGFAAWSAFGLVYVDHSGADNQLVQGAQADASWRATVDDMEALVDANEGVDVLYYGADLDAPPDEAYHPGPEPWNARQPLQWYTAAFDAEVETTRNPGDFRDAFDSHEPPIVVVDRADETTVKPSVDGYEPREHHRRWTFDMHIYLDLDRLGEPR